MRDKVLDEDVVIVARLLDGNVCSSPEVHPGRPLDCYTNFLFAPVVLVRKDGPLAKRMIRCQVLNIVDRPDGRKAVLLTDDSVVR